MSVLGWKPYVRASQVRVEEVPVPTVLSFKQDGAMFTIAAAARRALAAPNKMAAEVHEVSEPVPHVVEVAVADPMVEEAAAPQPPSAAVEMQHDKDVAEAAAAPMDIDAGTADAEHDGDTVPARPVSYELIRLGWSYHMGRDGAVSKADVLCAARALEFGRPEQLEPLECAGLVDAAGRRVVCAGPIWLTGHQWCKSEFRTLPEMAPHLPPRGQTNPHKKRANAWHDGIEAWYVKAAGGRVYVTLSLLADGVFAQHCHPTLERWMHAAAARAVKLEHTYAQHKAAYLTAAYRRGSTLGELCRVVLPIATASYRCLVLQHLDAVYQFVVEGEAYPNVMRAFEAHDGALLAPWAWRPKPDVSSQVAMHANHLDGVYIERMLLHSLCTCRTHPDELREFAAAMASAPEDRVRDVTLPASAPPAAAAVPRSRAKPHTLHRAPLADVDPAQHTVLYGHWQQTVCPDTQRVLDEGRRAWLHRADCREVVLGQSLRVQKQRPTDEQLVAQALEAALGRSPDTGGVTGAELTRVHETLGMFSADMVIVRGNMPDAAAVVAASCARIDSLDTWQQMLPDAVAPPAPVPADDPRPKRARSEQHADAAAAASTVHAAREIVDTAYAALQRAADLGPSMEDVAKMEIEKARAIIAPERLAAEEMIAAVHLGQALLSDTIERGGRAGELISLYTEWALDQTCKKKVRALKQCIAAFVTLVPAIVLDGTSAWKCADKLMHTTPAGTLLSDTKLPQQLVHHSVCTLECTEDALDYCKRFERLRHDFRSLECTPLKIRAKVEAYIRAYPDLLQIATQHKAIGGKWSNPSEPRVRQPVPTKIDRATGRVQRMAVYTESATYPVPVAAAAPRGRGARNAVNAALAAPCDGDGTDVEEMELASIASPAKRRSKRKRERKTGVLVGYVGEDGEKYPKVLESASCVGRSVSISKMVTL